ncbi:MAG TPA: hypothetical protein VN862_09795 [Candidatus Acidoferrales bacterium]|nr:hypothetical protein [Candidatus Acidoferrales bacterium]
MNLARSISAIAYADFLERVRRYSFLVTLLFAVYLGYAVATGKVLLKLGDYRSVYNSAWIGVMCALVTSLFVSLVGFYIVKGSVERDRQTGVGQILAATPLNRFSYLAGKAASNFGVLSSIVVILAAAALAMQLLVGEDPHVHLWPLLSPFLLIALPAMAFVAAFAVLFETVPGLRGGFGNVLWFFLWTFGLSLPEITKQHWLDPLGFFSAVDSLTPAAQAQLPDYKGGFSLTIADRAAKIATGFHWEGIDWTPSVIALRFAWLGVAVILIGIAAVFFDRFDPSRSRAVSARKLRGAQPADNLPQAEAGSITVPGELGTSAGGSTTSLVGANATPALIHLTPLTSRDSSGFPRIFTAELKLALKGLRWWWYAGALGLLIAQFAAPLPISRGPLLAAAWIWPVLVWSALGTRERRNGTAQILFSCARILPRQLPASWLAGVAIAALTGAGAALRLLIAGDKNGFLAWCAGALFIPSLALALGVITSTAKFFEGVFTVLWYVGPMNQTRGLDFTGAARSLYPARDAAIYLLLSAVLVAAAAVARARQLRHN